MLITFIPIGIYCCNVLSDFRIYQILISQEQSAKRRFLICPPTQPLTKQTPRHGFSFAKIHFSIQYSKEKLKKYFTTNKHRHPNSGHALLQYEFLNNRTTNGSLFSIYNFRHIIACRYNFCSIFADWFGDNNETSHIPQH